MNVLPDLIPVLDEELRTVRWLRRLNDVGAKYPEAAFDRLLATNVDAVAGALRSAGVLGEGCLLRVLAHAEQVAKMDLLLAESEGDELRRLVIVETKLFSNPEQHRKVLAQILDYANRLQFDVPVSEILAKSDPETRRWLQERQPELELIKARGDFLLVIAGDRIQPRLLELAKPMLDRGDRVLSGLQLTLLSLALYQDDTTRILIPNVVGALVRRDSPSSGVPVNKLLSRSRLSAKLVLRKSCGYFQLGSSSSTVTPSLTSSAMLEPRGWCPSLPARSMYLSGRLGSGTTRTYWT